MKKNSQKISLNTETLRNLDTSHLDKAAGGTAGHTICRPACTGTNVCSGCKPCF